MLTFPFILLPFLYATDVSLFCVSINLLSSFLPVIFVHFTRSSFFFAPGQLFYFHQVKFSPHLMFSLQEWGEESTKYRKQQVENHLGKHFQFIMYAEADVELQMLMLKC